MEVTAMKWYWNEKPQWWIIFTNQLNWCWCWHDVEIMPSDTGHHFNGNFPGKFGSANRPLYSCSPPDPNLSILSGHGKILHISLETVPSYLHASVGFPWPPSLCPISVIIVMFIVTSEQKIQRPRNKTESKTKSETNAQSTNDAHPWHLQIRSVKTDIVHTFHCSASHFLCLILHIAEPPAMHKHTIIPLHSHIPFINTHTPLSPHT